MKPYYLLIPLLLLLNSPAFGQEYYFGLRIGYSQSKLDSKNPSPLALKDRQAFTFAFTHNVRFDRSKFGFAIETGYVLKGARINDSGNDYRLHYFTMPALFDYYPIGGLRLSIGPEFAYLADARNRTTDSTSVDINNVYDNRLEVSATVGLTYALDFFVDVGARYTRGFSRFQNFDAILNRREQYNSYFQVFFSFKIAN